MALSKKEAIEALERRADFLAKKIADEPRPGRQLHRERVELGAIQMAIQEMDSRGCEPAVCGQ